MIRRLVLSLFVAGLVMLPASGAFAQSDQPYKIGVAAGLTGYVATIDRAWSDAVRLAAKAVNDSGGIMGRQIEVIVEDNRSEPQEAVTVYRKMITSDEVDIFVSGCVSAGNFAAAGMLVRAQTPMVVCSILPKEPEQVKWAFTTLPPPRFEVATRLEYLQEETDISKIGVIHDPSPYATLQKDITLDIADEYGLEVVGAELYDQDDADLSAQISKLAAGGAEAILKMGVGGSTLTAAKNISQLGLSDLLLLTSLEDIGVFEPVAEVLGDKFYFVASPAQVYEALPEGPLKDEIESFLEYWRTEHGDRDPNWAGRGWDAVMIVMAAIEKAGSTDGAAVRDALEAIGPFQGTTGVYHFTPENHQGITENPLFLARIKEGKVEIVH